MLEKNNLTKEKEQESALTSDQLLGKIQALIEKDFEFSGVLDTSTQSAKIKNKIKTYEEYVFKHKTFKLEKLVIESHIDHFQNIIVNLTLHIADNVKYDFYAYWSAGLVDGVYHVIQDRYTWVKFGNEQMAKFFDSYWRDSVRETTWSPDIDCFVDFETDFCSIMDSHRIS